MSTIIRPEISEKSKYWIDKHRYYELKHFCLQYPTWKKAYNSLTGLYSSPNLLIPIAKTNNISDPVYKCLEARLYYSERIELIEKIAKLTDLTLSSFILLAVTQGRSYDYLKTNLNIPCCKDTYYNLYRRFFWLLNKERK